MFSWIKKTYVLYGSFLYVVVGIILIIDRIVKPNKLNIFRAQ